MREQGIQKETRLVRAVAAVALNTPLFFRAPDSSQSDREGDRPERSDEKRDQEKPKPEKPRFDYVRLRKIAGVGALLIGAWGVNHALRSSAKKNLAEKPTSSATELAKRDLPELLVVDQSDLLKRLAEPNDVEKVAYTHIDNGGLVRYEFPLVGRPNSAVHVQWFSQGAEHSQFIKSLSEAGVVIKPGAARQMELQRADEVRWAEEEEILARKTSMLELLFLGEKALALTFVTALTMGLLKKLVGPGGFSAAFGRMPGLENESKPGDEIIDRPVEGFDHIGGIQQVIEELTFLRDEIKRVQSGGVGLELPKGILLYGPPGTGKTMLARAIAAETDCPFISFKGSSLATELWVGSGLRKVRNAFAQAREQRDKRTKELQSNGNPNSRGVCVVFIDEFDSIAVRRSSGEWASHEENRVVNTLLTELDNIHKDDDNSGSNRNIVVIAATNDLHGLDPAVIRSGRFNRRIEIPPPQSKLARLDVLEKSVKYVLEKNGWTIEDRDNSLEKVARMTVGASGADLIGILEKAQALVQRRGGSKEISFADLMEGFQQHSFGFKMTQTVSQDERRKVAFHELVGHGAISWACEIATFLISMEPRGRSLGRVIPDPEAISELMPSKKQLLQRILVNLAGQEAEKLRYGELGATIGNTSIGGADDDSGADLDNTRKLIKILISSGLVGEDVAVSLVSGEGRNSTRLSDMHRELINRVYKRAATAVSEILGAISNDEWDAIVEECLNLKEELVGTEAQKFLERHLGSRPHFREVARRVLDEYYADPMGKSPEASREAGSG